jgi:hypothetical protein
MEGMMPETEYAASDPRHYGVDPEEIVACYFEGTLTPELVAEGRAYDWGYYHKACESAARQMFTTLAVEKPSIEASELDWSQPYHCDVCEESIT